MSDTHCIELLIIDNFDYTRWLLAMQADNFAREKLFKNAG